MAYRGLDRHSAARCALPGLLALAWLGSGPAARGQGSAPAQASPPAATNVLGRDFNENEGVFGDVRASGYYRVRYYRDLARDNDAENTDELRNDFRSELKTEIGKSMQALVSINGQYDLDDNARDGKRVEQENLGLWEAYLKARTRSVDLWLGKQVIRWGKSDEINPTDNFTPEDFSEFINQDRVDRKIPVWMLRGDYYWDRLTYELIVLPYFVPSPNIPGESDWYLPALRGLEAAGFTVDENEPEHTFKNAVAANKLAYHSEDFDASVSYANHFNEVAAPQIRPPRVVFGYHRQHSFGADFEFTSGEVGIRGEGVYTTRDSFGTSDPAQPDGVKERDTVSVVVGADHTFESEVYLNVQYFVRHIQGYTEDLAAKEFDHSLIWSMSRKFLREDLELAFTGRYYLDPEGYFLCPEIKYRINDFVRIRLLASFFGGDKDNFMGQYDDNDQLGLELKMMF